MIALPTKDNVVTVTDLRRNTKATLKKVQEKGIMYVYYDSKIRLAMMSLEHLEKMVSKIEKLKDELLDKFISENK